jgi:hypothetical protein
MIFGYCFNSAGEGDSYSFSLSMIRQMMNANRTNKRMFEVHTYYGNGQDYGDSKVFNQSYNHSHFNSDSHNYSIAMAMTVAMQ